MNTNERPPENAHDQTRGYSDDGQYVLDRFVVSDPAGSPGFSEKSYDEASFFTLAMYHGEPIRITEYGYFLDQADAITDAVYVGDTDGNGTSTFFRIPAAVKEESAALSRSRTPARPEQPQQVEQRTLVLPQDAELPVARPTLEDMEHWAFTSESAKVFSKAQQGDVLALFEMQHGRVSATTERLEAMRDLVATLREKTKDAPVSTQGDAFDLKLFSNKIDKIATDFDKGEPLALEKITSSGGLRDIAKEIMTNPLYAPLRGRFEELLELGRESHDKKPEVRTGKLERFLGRFSAK
ncbi:MAG TPA: hypothetical protein VGE34_04385 [Candidatus Saccharimonadales bacterium]